MASLAQMGSSEVLFLFRLARLRVPGTDFEGAVADYCGTSHSSI